jgi:iron complex outermembrane receptor protein
MTTLPAVASAEDNPQLDEVVVSAPKAGAGSAIGATGPEATDLAAMRPATSDAASLLRDTPGVSLYGAGGVSSLPAIHGLADDRLRIKVDGMDLIAACPNHMNPPLSYLDPAQVGALTVYTGIAPVSLGGDSIGGSIVAETPAPVFASPGETSLVRGEAGAFYRSNGNARGGNLAATYATESLSVSYNGAVAKSGNYDAGDDFKNSIFGTSPAADPTYTGRPGHILPLDEVGSTAYDTRNHNLGLAFRAGKHLLDATLGFQDVPEQLYPNQRMDMLDNEAKRLNLRYRGDFDWGNLEARTYHEEVDHFMDFGADKKYWYWQGTPDYSGAPCDPATAPQCAAGMPMYTASENTGIVLKTDLSLSEQDLLRIGTEYQRYRLDDWWPASGAGMAPYTFWNINDGQRDRAALFGEWERQLDAQWLTLAGLRYERVTMEAGEVHGYNLDSFPIDPSVAGPGNQTRDAALFNSADRRRTDDNWDMTVLARYAPDATRDVEFGFAHKTRSPNLYERYAWSTWTMAALMVNWTGDGNGYIGNLDLEPEKANTVSASFGWHAADRRREFKATPWYTRVSDYIDAIQWDAAANAPATTLATNQFTVLKFVNQSAQLYGLDLSGRLPLAQTGAGEFGLRGLVSYVVGENRDTGDELYNIMPLNAKLTLTHKQRGWDNAAEVVLVGEKDELSDLRNEIETGNYSLVNLHASHSWKRTRLDFGVENLFDRLYFQPLGGAYLGQGTTMSSSTMALTTPKWGTVVPGMGRSVYAGVNVKF